MKKFKLSGVIKKNDSLTYAETFAGAGGSHLGFLLNGFKTLYINEINQTFIKTLLQNNLGIEHAIIDVCPIEEVIPESVLERTSLLKGELGVLFGGIVCKGYSLAGVRDPNDYRNRFYQYQLKLVDALRPKICIIENVPSMANALIPSSTAPADIKKRMSLICKKLEDYKGLKAKLRKNGTELSRDEDNQYLKVKSERIELEQVLRQHSVSVMQDIKDIYSQLGYRVYTAKLNAAWYGSATKRVRLIIVAVRVDIKKDYEFPVIEYYDNYLGPTNGVKLAKHVKKPRTVSDALQSIDYSGINNPEIDPDNKPMNHDKKTVQRFKYVPLGKNIVDIMDHLPLDLHISRYYSRGCTMRLDPDKPAPTLVPGHSNFPIHPTEDRSITVREAASMMGFPLTYKFAGNHTQRCEQVGNAVPVELASAIAKSVIKLLID